MAIRSRGASWTLLAFVAMLPVVLKAGPTLPVKNRLPDEIRCLSGIHRVSLAFAPLPRNLREAGINEDALRGIIEERLGQAQIVIEDDQTVKPWVVVSLRSAAEPDLPDVLAIALTLELHQDVAVLRLEKDNRMTLPTTTFAGITVARADQIRRAVDHRFRSLVNTMLRSFNQARDERRSRRRR